MTAYVLAEMIRDAVGANVFHGALARVIEHACERYIEQENGPGIDRDGRTPTEVLRDHAKFLGGEGELTDGQQLLRNPPSGSITWTLKSYGLPTDPRGGVYRKCEIYDADLVPFPIAEAMMQLGMIRVGPAGNRMTRAMVAELIPVLQQFVLTGDLTPPRECDQSAPSPTKD